MKKIIISIITLSILTLSWCWSSSNNWITIQEIANNIEKQDWVLQIYYFWWDWCPHCARQNEFWKSVEEEYDNIQINRFETWKNRDNQRLLQRVALNLWINIWWIPITFIWDWAFPWFWTAETSWKAIKEKIDQCLLNECDDLIFDIIKNFE